MHDKQKHIIINALSVFILNNKVTPEDVIILMNPVTSIEFFGIVVDIDGVEIKRCHFIEQDKFVIALKKYFEPDFIIPEYSAKCY